MQCLEGYIGINGCGASEPPSGLCVNDLPGINKIIAEKIADEEQADLLGVWRDVEKRTLKKFATKLITALSSYRVKSICDTVDFGQELSSLTSSGIGGVHIDLTKSPSNFQKLHIEWLKLYVPYGETAPDVIIYDLIKNEIIQTVQLDGDLWVEKYLNLTLESEKVLIYFTPDYDVPGLSLDEDNCLCECFSCEAVIKGISGDFADPTFGTNTSGLSLQLSVLCSLEAFVCKNRNLFAVPLWYETGVEFLTERLYSTRLTRFTTVDLGRAKELRTELMAEADIQLRTVLNGIDFNQRDCCLECDDEYKSAWVRP